MEPLFWLFRILFFPLLPLLTAIRARSKGWDELLSSMGAQPGLCREGGRVTWSCNG
jgi:hypothetical protein